MASEETTLLVSWSLSRARDIWVAMGRPPGIRVASVGTAQVHRGYSYRVIILVDVWREHGRERIQEAVDELRCRLEPNGLWLDLTPTDRVSAYSNILRELASYVGAGGWNSSGLIEPEQALEKIRWGIDHMLDVERARAAERRVKREPWGTGA